MTAVMRTFASGAGGIGGDDDVVGGRSGAGARGATMSWRGESAHAGSVAPGVAEQRERLAPAAAEIRVPLVAGPARLRHPGVAAERPQRRRVAPDRRRANALADVLEGEPGDAARLVARQHHAVGRDHDVAPRPAVHARARAIRVVVGAHEQDLDLAAQPLGGGGARRRAPVRCPRAPAAARPGSRAPSRGTACWRAPAAPRRSAPRARRTR